MKFKLGFIIALLLLLLFLFFVNLSKSKKIQILSPLARTTGTPTLTPRPTSTPTPTPTAVPTPIPTPTTTPTPTTAPLTSTDLEDLFTKYSNLYSVDKNMLRKIAACESGFNTNAVFRDYVGLFQFSSGAWINSRALMGQDGNLDLRTNAEESIKTAAFKISRGEISAWPNCSK